ncbi:MAG: peptidyl-prolyl cis-trans isomerase [Bacteroidota bacterium]
MKYFIYLTLIAVFLLGCKEEKDTSNKKPIAKIHEKNLYLSDVEDVIPDNKSKEDSSMIAENYIRNWIKKQLLLKKAEKNLSKDNKDIQKQIEEYRTSLLIYRYQQQLIDQKLDTAVSEEEIQEYYEDNTSNFTLDINLVKVLYVELPQNSPNISSVKSWMKSEKEEDISKLKDYCYQYAKKYDDFNNEWIAFNKLENKIPTDIKNPQRFLKYNKNLEEKDSLFHYFVRINDYKLKGEPAPVSYVREKIESVMLNKRKHKLLEDLEKDLYNEALNRNEFIIY